MGYFSNGTEADFYSQEYCEKCRHFEGCAVWFAHIVHNYAECNNENSILHILIPRKGLENLQCAMFIPIDESAA